MLFLSIIDVFFVTPINLVVVPPMLDLYNKVGLEITLELNLLLGIVSEALLF
jgi:hypothetical protein